MADQQGVKLRGVDWGEIFPWLILVRCFRIAIQLRLLVLSAVGFVLMLAGWGVIDWAFSGSQAMQTADVAAQASSYCGCPRLAANTLIPDSPRWVGRPAAMEAPATSDPASPPSAIARESYLDRHALGGWGEELWSAWNRFWSTWEHLSRPFRAMFITGMGVTGSVYLLLCGLWATAVWGYFGAVVTRAAAYELATRERLGLAASLKHATGGWRSYFGSIVLPLVGILMVTLLTCVPSLPLASKYFIWLSGIAWPLVLAGGLVLAVLALGLLFGWPIMWGSLGAERPDSFDAIGRGYQFTFQRPLHYLFYAAVAAVLGGLGWVVVSNFVAVVVGLSWWAASWVGTAERIRELAAVQSQSGWISGGASLIQFWVECLKLVGVGYLFSYFWTASTAIYYLLRRDIDATEMDEVYIEEEATAPLPPIRTDASGAPVMSEPGTEAAQGNAMQ